MRDAKVLGNEFGPDRVAVPVEVARRVRRKGHTTSDDPVEQAVIDRIVEARDVYRRLPGVGLVPVESDREFERPGPREISRAHEVACEWPGLLPMQDQRRLFKWFFLGLSWRRAAQADPDRRSGEGLRKAFYAMVGVLVSRLSEKYGCRRKLLLTEFRK
ncbi:MAG: hypothetical protein M0006_02370 [Magnetospirillum sp.]|nr:hypothetical protein [Magnetospirillum sp.]